MFDRFKQRLCEDFGLLALLAEAGGREHGARHKIGGNRREVVGRV